MKTLQPLRSIEAGVLNVALYEAGASHNLPQEKPQVFADAVLELVNAWRSAV